MASRDPRSQRGQAAALFALTLSALVLGAAVAIDGGFAFSQRRLAQNAADFAAMAGTRIVGEALTERPAGAGTAANVEGAVKSALAANGAELVGAQYVDEHGVLIGDVVGASIIPTHAFGVVVSARTDWEPFLLGVLGVDEWVASASATAVTSGESAGGVIPLGIRDEVWEDLAQCPLDDIQDCLDGLTESQLNISGGFGWLKFGIDDAQCNWPGSLGMDEGGCENDQNFLDFQLGPPANSFNCCDPVGSGPDRIGSLTGNEWGNLDYYVENPIVVWIPIWDYAGSSGSNSYYHIVGFGAIRLTGHSEHAKWLQGAAIDVTDLCAIPGTNYCAKPGKFSIGATGEVKLVR
jgi:hypothetical protein